MDLCLQKNKSTVRGFGACVESGKEKGRPLQQVLSDDFNGISG